MPAGQYLLEVWIDDVHGNTAIYPDTSYPSVIGFSIKRNIMTATSTVITTITLADFEAKFDDLQKDLQNKVTSGYFKGDKGDQGIQGVQGVQGVQGKAFQIAKTYGSVADMNASKGTGLSDGDFVMIASSVSDTDNAKLYTWNGTNFVYIDDLSGAQGIQGPQGPQGVSGSNGKDATINVVTQAQYDALTDKTGVYFIEG